MLIITPHLAIEENEFEERFVRSSGPGGQNVNKVATAVQLRFDIGRSSLPEAIRERLVRLAGRRVTAEGVLVLEASEFRTQEQNREAARERLIMLIRRAAERPKPRRATRPTLASKERRLADKRGRSQTKQLRRTKPDRGE